ELPRRRGHVGLAAADALRPGGDHRRHPRAGGGRLGDGRRRATRDGAADAVGALMRLRRAVVALVALTAIYGIAAEIGHGRLPDRIWMGSHYVENVQLLPTFGALAEEGAFLLESKILAESIVASSRRVLIGVLLGSLIGILLGLGTGWAMRFEHLADPWVTLFRF